MPDVTTDQIAGQIAELRIDLRDFLAEVREAIKPFADERAEKLAARERDLREHAAMDAQMAAVRQARDDQAAEEAAAVVDVFRTLDEGAGVSRRDLAAALPDREPAASAAIEETARRGLLVEVGAGYDKSYRLPSPAA